MTTARLSVTLSDSEGSRLWASSVPMQAGERRRTAQRDARCFAALSMTIWMPRHSRGSEESSRLQEARMIIGSVRELKTQEYRVGLTPEGADALVRRGHRVLVEAGAGVGSG